MYMPYSMYSYVYLIQAYSGNQLLLTISAGVNKVFLYFYLIILRFVPCISTQKCLTELTTIPQTIKIYH